MRILKHSTLTSTLAAAVVLLLNSGPSFAGNAYDGHVQCESKNCKVDLYLMRGFRAFSQCQVCHGIDGNGSTIAPSLMTKMRELDHATFVDRVKNGFTGQIGVMPAWESNPNVMKYLDNLYAYLKARSDQVIPAGRLARFDRGDESSATASAPGSGDDAPATVTANNSGTPASSTPSSHGVFGSRGNLQQAQ